MRKIIQDEAFGFVPVLKTKQGWKFLLVKNAPMRKGQKGHWSFPKGHREEGEKDVEVAKRELFEETGISKMDSHEKYKFYEEYSFRGRNKSTIKKKVTYFLCFVFDDTVKIQEEEIIDYKWAYYKEALNIATFYNAKNILKQSQHILNSNFNK